MFHEIKMNGNVILFIIRRVEMLIVYHYIWVWEHCGPFVYT